MPLSASDLKVAVTNYHSFLKIKNQINTIYVIQAKRFWGEDREYESFLTDEKLTVKPNFIIPKPTPEPIPPEIIQEKKQILSQESILRGENTMRSIKFILTRK